MIRRPPARPPAGGTAGATLGAAALAASLLAPPAAAGQVRGETFEPVRLGDEFVLVVGATLIDGTGSPPRPDAAVLVRNGMIEAVGTAGEVRGPVGTQVLNGRGRWLVPGFVDAHAHAADTAVLRALLAHGVTAIRSPSSPARDGVDYRSLANSGDVPAPHVTASGPPIDAPPGRWPGSSLVETEEEVRRVVRAHAGEGADFIKLYVGLPPPLVEAAVEEAHGLGLKVMGDLVVTGWTRAARAGIDHLSRIVSRSPELLPPEARGRYVEDVKEGLAHPYTRWLELVELDGAQVEEMVGALLMRDVVVDPDLSAIESVLLCADSVHRAETGDYFPGAPLDEEAEGCEAGRWPADFTERARAAWPKALELTRRLHREGVMLAAGTDAPLGRLPAGAALHRELELLVRAGIPPLHALRIGTRNGAVALGRLSETGSIEPGKRADLVLLTADPLEDIRATRAIEWVMLRGEVLAPALLATGEG